MFWLIAGDATWPVEQKQKVFIAIADIWQRLSKQGDSKFIGLSQYPLLIREFCQFDAGIDVLLLIPTERNTCEFNWEEKIAFSRNLKGWRTLEFFQIANLREGFLCVCSDSKQPYNRFLACANSSVPLIWKEHLKALRQQRCCHKKHQRIDANIFHLPSSSFIGNQGMRKKLIDTL